jgi:hypothetical protein
MVYESYLASFPAAMNAAAVLPWGASPRMREASAGRSPSLDKLVPKMGTCQARVIRLGDLRVKRLEGRTGAAYSRSKTQRFRAIFSALIGRITFRRGTSWHR